MVLIAAIGAWLVLSVLAYMIFKRAWVNRFSDWTVSDRRAMLVVSPAGPIALVAAGITWLNGRPSNNAPAKW